MRKLNKIRIKYAIILIASIIFLLAILPTFMRYRVDVTANAEGYAKETRSSTYKVKFHTNGGTGTMSDMTVSYNVAQNLTKNTFTRTDYYFAGWNTEANGSGTDYNDEQEIRLTAYITGNEINLYAKWVSGVAEVNGIIYSTLQDAINAVPTDNTQTTVKLLTNVSEAITIEKNKNIIFNLQNYTISNNGINNVIKNSGTIVISNGKIITTATNTSNDKVVEIINEKTGSITINGGEFVVTNSTNAGSVIMNKGALTITNGRIQSNAATNGAINNESSGNLTVSGGQIIVTGNRQAIYNNKGIAEISGNAYMSSASTERATVQNLAGGTLTIKGGTIISTSANGDKGAVQNAGTMTIGTEDGNPNKNSLIIQGADYGVNSSTNFSFYDGTIKGVTKPIYNEAKVTNIETGYDIAKSEDIVNNITYKTTYLAITKTVRFNANGGTVSETTRKVETGKKVGELPEPDTRSGFVFDGWFTLATGGTEVTSEEIITADIEFFAHWTKAPVAKIGQTEYDTLQDAINAVPNNTQTTVTLIRDTKENITVGSNKNIVFDLGNYTIRNNIVDAVIINEGTIRITNGTINQTCAFAAINNNFNGKVIMTGGRIISTGGKSAIFTTDDAIVEISGDAYLSSNASGYTTTSVERATVMSVSTDSNTTITGGTIISTGGLGVSDVGTLTIGVKADGNINTSSPVILGETYGVKSLGTFNFYDGVIKGLTDVILGTITDQEPNTQIANGTEIIDNKTYITGHLELNI